MTQFRKRRRAGFTFVEMLVCVAIITLILATAFTGPNQSKQSALGTQMAMMNAFERAKSEAHGPAAGSTVLFVAGPSGNTQALIYDGIAGTTFVNTIVSRVDVPVSFTNATTNAGATLGELALMFSKDGNFTYGKWTIGSAYTPVDCHNNLQITFENARGSTLGSMQATCGSQIPAFYNPAGVQTGS